MKDLTEQLNRVAASKDLESAKDTTSNLITISDATDDKKQSSQRILERLSSRVSVVAFAYNYAMSGEGLKVI